MFVAHLTCLPPLCLALKHERRPIMRFTLSFSTSASTWKRKVFHVFQPVEAVAPLTSMKAYAESECACQSVRQSVSQRVGVAYLAWAIAHNVLKPPIKSFATIEMMPASLMRLDKSLISTQLQQGEKQIRERGREGRVEEREGERGAVKVQNTSTAAKPKQSNLPLTLAFDFEICVKGSREVSGGEV